MRSLRVFAVALALASSGAAVAEDYSVELCSSYASQYEANPTQDNIGKLMSAASCHEKGHRPADALTAWRRVAKDATNADTKRTAVDSVTRLEPLVPTIQIDGRPGAGAVTATIDGSPATLGAAVPVNLGSHTIATSDGRSQTHASAEREHFTILVPFDPPSGGAGGGGAGGEGGAPPSGGPSGLLVGGAIATAVGGLGLVGFAITGGLSLSKDSELDEICNADRTNCGGPKSRAKAREIADFGDAVNAANAAMLVVAGVGVAVGVPLIVVGARSGRPAAALHLPLPWATRDAGGVAWSGAF